MRFGWLLALFFGSGVCGLIYQVLWLRLLSLVFGVTVYAASTVLAAFMTGLALGSALAGPLLARVDRPLRVFGLAEIFIGISALLTPIGLDVASAFYQWVHHVAPGSLPLLTAARLVASFAVLLLPTVLMGLTLPVLSASSVVRASRFGSRVSALYAINTAGAVTGAVLTGFYLIGAIGIQQSFLVGALINILVGVGAILMSRWVEGSADTAATSPPSTLPSSSPITVIAPIPVNLVGVVIAVSGFAALALEIVWFRTLVQYLAATTYAFTTMLATVLAGIALGGLIGAAWLRRDREWVGVLVITQIATALAVLGSAIFLGWSYQAGWRTGSDIQASVAAILPAAILMGISFPIAIRIAVANVQGMDAPTAARRVGRMYSLNVVGAIAGALLGGFVLLPLLGARRALILLAAIYGASAVILLLRHRRRNLYFAGFAVATIAFLALADRVPDPFRAAYVRRYGRDMREFWREEGVQTAVSVHASQFRRSLYLDGLHQANDTPDMVRLHRTIGHLPMVLHRSPSDALVIGLGGGATSGAVSRHGGRVQVIELSSSVRRAAEMFAHINYDILQQPNVQIRIDDGRNFLMLSGEKFDVITADIIQPIHAGAGNLYSREYFTLVRQALKDNGIALQWIGERPTTQYKLIMRTFLDVFPHATLWLGGNLMVGSVGPLKVDPALFADKRANPRIAEALDAIGLSSFETLTSWYLAGPEEMRRFVGTGPLLTDDRPVVEYHRSLPANDPTADLSTLRGAVPQ